MFSWMLQYNNLKLFSTVQYVNIPTKDNKRIYTSVSPVYSKWGFSN